MGSRPDERAVLRRLARDHWVRLNGTPRITILVGELRARTLWSEWTALSRCDASLLAGDDDFDAAVRAAMARTMTSPCHAVAIVARTETVDAWWVTANDRSRTLVAEGRLDIPDATPGELAPMGSSERPPASAAAARPVALASPNARSMAEATLFEALEATPATRGRFELNGRISLRFGRDAAEVDLLARRDGIAVEIDGYHHFTDVDAYRRDRRKDLLLQTHGLLVLRLLADDVMRDPREALNMICQALAYRLEQR